MASAEWAAGRLRRGGGEGNGAGGRPGRAPQRRRGGCCCCFQSGQGGRQAGAGWRATHPRCRCGAPAGALREVEEEPPQGPPPLPPPPPPQGPRPAWSRRRPSTRPSRASPPAASTVAPSSAGSSAPRATPTRWRWSSRTQDSCREPPERDLDVELEPVAGARPSLREHHHHQGRKRNCQEPAPLLFSLRPPWPWPSPCTRTWTWSWWAAAGERPSPRKQQQQGRRRTQAPIDSACLGRLAWLSPCLSGHRIPWLDHQGPSAGGEEPEWSPEPVHQLQPGPETWLS